MRKMPLFILVGILVSLAVIVGVIVAFSGETNASTRFNAASSPSQPTANPYPPGSPAIQPHLPGIPSFTLADVANYIQTKSFMTTTSGTPPVITNAEFITAQQASALLDGEYIGRPDNALVCYVELQGPFRVKGPLPSGATVPTVNTGYELFDAQTGNLLMWGFGS